MDKLRYVGVALVAGVVGASVALLLAPYSGEETRRLIRRRYEKERAQLMKRGRRLANDAGGYVEDRLEDGRKAMGEIADDMSDRMEAGRKKISRIVKA